ncbi:uncharacterized protein LOC114716789 isoform X2 [Neltuma alba]|uniref:uncharacterized protein LOC114716789 isoform X2 n=1 Tax=Neltuma alba TaxID=207710 RepID=UPI0010A567CE|nr:uncharacterized protein LOC114716789 isoform X2 [Prosopis alba]
MALLDLPRDQPSLSFPLTHSHGCPNGTGTRLATQSKEADDDSGICSPPLWRTSPPRSPQQRKNYYRSLSPASRTQAVARGQMELMEMVRNMPERTYELSLKDLVERPWVDARDENAADDRNPNGKRGQKRESNIRKMKKGSNVDRGGFYLKMMFPASLGSKKKKKNESSANGSSKVSPRHSLSEGSVKAADKDWWKKSLSASAKSDSGVSTINSGSVKSSGSNSGRSRNNSRKFSWYLWNSNGPCLRL